MRNPSMFKTTDMTVSGMLVALLLMAATTVVVADENMLRSRDAMQTRMAEIMADPAAREAAAAAGKERGSFCAYCHGKHGISKKNWLPNLAGQSARYILDQNIAYALGKRENRIMNDLTENLTDEELINLSVFYAVQTPEPIDVDVSGRDLTVGKKFFQAACVHCHGEDGRGEKGYTWIAGQKQEYVRRALTRYRDSEEGRRDKEMSEVTANITDQLIDNLAAYIATLN